MIILKHSLFRRRVYASDCAFYFFKFFGLYVDQLVEMCAVTGIAIADRDDVVQLLQVFYSPSSSPSSSLAVKRIDKLYLHLLFFGALDNCEAKYRVSRKRCADAERIHPAAPDMILALLTSHLFLPKLRSIVE